MATLHLLTSVQFCRMNCDAFRKRSMLVRSRNYRTTTTTLRGCLRETEMENRAAAYVEKHYNKPVPSQVTLEAGDCQIKISKVEKSRTYMFRMDIGGQVKVSIRKKGSYDAVAIEVSSLPHSPAIEMVVLSWETFRSRTSRGSPMEVPLVRRTEETFMVELEFEETIAPFTMSFFLKIVKKQGRETVKVGNHRRSDFTVPVGFNRGCPEPLGVSFSSNGTVNFAVSSKSAQAVALCLFERGKPVMEIDLDPYFNRSGYVWHLSIDSKWSGYAWKVMKEGQQLHRNWIVDPYARICAGFGLLRKLPHFDWKGDARRHRLPPEKLVVYRLNVEKYAGTFGGVTMKIDHLKTLGVNAVLLEPIFPFDHRAGHYYPTHFFSLADPDYTAVKEMVRELHASGIEVFMEVVFTHTADGGALREIDEAVYYHDDDLNSMNCNYPVVQQLILDSLRHWAVDFHVDGFCFVAASSLLRGFHGEQLSRPPIVESIAFDPVLSGTKIIADAWDPRSPASTEPVQFPHWKRWAEVNGRFSSDVRSFVNGSGRTSSLATRLCGSGDVFSAGRSPAFSFNYVTRNSGPTLVDSVSFTGDGDGWNCGEEGPTRDAAVLETRLKQTRNLIFVLFVSLGVPVINMGDEYGCSAGGSPDYRDRTAFDWDGLNASFARQTVHLISYLSAFRNRRCDVFQTPGFWKAENIEWFGGGGSPPVWDDRTCRFLAVRLTARGDGARRWSDLFLGFNAGDGVEDVVLPLPPPGMRWHRMVDTSLSFPGFFTNTGEPALDVYRLTAHASVLFEARSD